MAEITCCTGQTECNHVVTIGYLKSFIGTNIKDSDGNTVNVNTTKADSYAPTYAELAGGTLLPLFVDGGNGNWYNNVDGIKINGTYTDGQSVQQDDLTLIYTRLNSVTLSCDKTMSAPNTVSISECGDDVEVCIRANYSKTVKLLNNCSVSSVTTTNDDTNCNGLDFTVDSAWATLSNCSNNCAIVTIGKNGSWSSNTRTCIVNAVVSYKGGATTRFLNIYQRALTGSYSVCGGTYYTGVEITGHSETTQNTCASVTVNANAVGSFYDRYKWKDSCDLVYDENTPGFVSYDDRYGSEELPQESYTFPATGTTPPATTVTVSHTITVNYHGFSDSVTFNQVCEGSCTDVYEYGTCPSTYVHPQIVDKCGGNVTVSCSIPTTIHHKGWVGGACVETATTTTAFTQSAVVVIPENTQKGGEGHTCVYSNTATTAEGGRIPYTITQDCSWPCSGCGESAVTYAFGTVNVGCSAHTNEQVLVPYTATSSYTSSVCEDDVETSTSAYTINVDCNLSNAARTFTSGGTLGNFTIRQAAGPCCVVYCSCQTDLTLSTNSLSWDWPGTPQKTVTITSSSCISNIALAGDYSTNFNASLSNSVISVQPKRMNMTTGDYNATLTVTYDSVSTGGTNHCSKDISLTQTKIPCDCDDEDFGLVIIGERGVDNPFPPGMSFGNWLATFERNTDCVTAITVINNSSSIVSSAYTQGNDVYIDLKVWSNQYCQDRTGSVTLRGTMLDGSTCDKIIYFTQTHRNCTTAECTCYVVSAAANVGQVPSTATTATVVFDYSAITWTTNECCRKTSALTETDSASTTVSIATATCDSYIETGSVAWTNHKACVSNGCSSNDVNISWTVTKSKPAECACDCDSVTWSSYIVSKTGSSSPYPVIHWVDSNSCMETSSIVATPQSDCSSWITYAGLVPQYGELILFTIQPNDNFCNRQGTVNVQYTLKNGVTCSKNVTFYQEGIPCSCSSFTLSNYTAQVSGTSSAVRLSTVTNTYDDSDNPCVSIIAAWPTGDSTGWYSITVANNTEIKGTVQRNTESIARLGEVLVSGVTACGDSCTKIFTISQEACQCNNSAPFKAIVVTITKTTLDPCGASNQEVGTYELLCDLCNRSNLSYRNQWTGLSFTFNSNGKIYATYPSASTAHSNQQIDFMYDGTRVKQVGFSQGICCNCNVLTLTDDSGNPLPSYTP